MWQKATLRNVRRPQDKPAVGCTFWVSGKPYLADNGQWFYPHSNIILKTGLCALVRKEDVELLAEFSETPPEHITSVALGVDV